MYELMDLLVVVGAIVVLLGAFYGVQLRLKDDEKNGAEESSGAEREK